MDGFQMMSAGQGGGVKQSKIIKGILMKHEGGWCGVVFRGFNNLYHLQ